MHLVLTALALLFFIPWNNAYSLLYLDVNRGKVEPLPVAIEYFESSSQGANEISNSIYNIMKNDLESSGIFHIIQPNSFIEKVGFNNIPNYNSWRIIKATALIVGKVEILENGQVMICFRIWDPYREKQIGAASYTIEKSASRRAAHIIADEIYKAKTGENGYFDTRIAIIAESGTATNKIKRLAIMDQDGANFRYLTDGRKLVITPRFDSKSQKIAYMSYSGRIPQVFILDLNTGLQRLVCKFPGMSFAPRFSPDSSHLLMSIAKDGSTSIYEIEVMGSGGNLKRLTNDNGTISTSPSYSPDGKMIVFSSDRNGSQQLYIMNRDGSSIQRISYGDGSYSTPVWSPRGDFIAFTKKKENKFFIGVIRPDGTGERLLSSGWLVEGPSWSPNGRFIIFTRQDKGVSSQIYVVDITGYIERLVATKMPASGPAWSPILQKCKHYP